MGELKKNMYWVTETEDNRNYIGMSIPERRLTFRNSNSIPKKCFPKRRADSIKIDMGNNIEIKAESSSDIKDININRSTIGDLTTGPSTTSVSVDALQFSVLIVVPIIDSFDTDFPTPINGAAATSRNFRIGTGEHNLDIQVNGDGTATINGVPAEQSQLPDGTKVLIYRNNPKMNVEKTNG